MYCWLLSSQSVPARLLKRIPVLCRFRADRQVLKRSTGQSEESSTGASSSHSNSVISDGDWLGGRLPQATQ